MSSITSGLNSLLRVLKSQGNIPPASLYGLGVYINRGTVYLYYRSSHNTLDGFNIAKSRDGFNFNLFRENIKFTNYKKTEDFSRCSEFQFSRHKDQTHILYKRTTNFSSSMISVLTTDLLHYEYGNKNTDIKDVGVVVSNHKHEGKYLMYNGAKKIAVFTSPDLVEWNLLKESVLESRSDSFDYGPLEVEHVLVTDRGILLFYHSKLPHDGYTKHVVGAALFDKNDPTKLLWRSSQPVWEQLDEWNGKPAHPIGVIEFEGRIISYWCIDGESIFAVVYSQYKIFGGIKTRNVSLNLDKATHNPIISPKSDNHWEAFNTFNPAAIYEDGKVHLLYRAQGYDYISVLGYATSSDGYTIDERHDKPVYVPQEQFERQSGKPSNVNFDFVSGGGYGGCEDPRLTRIGDRIYMTYVAFDGMSPPRVALTSIDVEDFLNRRWLWERPVIISPPGVVDKNAVIFPEKINGKYVVMHRIYPDILIDYVDTLAFDGSWWLKGEHKISPRPTMWDSRKLGAGAPPIKTKDGWLLIYQSVGNQDPGKYKMGAMLLDLNDPSKVLHRCTAPILEPTEHYENHGFKAGVAYPCGAVVIKDTLFVYYGGADSYVCVATANLDAFLTELKYSEIAKLDPVIINKVM